MSGIVAAATKLILNCRSLQTAEVAADIIGKQERVDVTESRTHEGLLGGSNTYTENIRETHIVMPSEIQALPELVGYLDIADGSPPARVEVQYRDYPRVNQRLVAAP